MLCIPADFSMIFLLLLLCLSFVQLFLMTRTTDTGINDTNFDPYIFYVKIIIFLLHCASLFSTLLGNYSLS